MTVRFIIGRAGSGKSERCLDEIRRLLLESQDDHPLIMLVPEQATFQAEYALVTTPGLSGMIRAQVLSFRRLAFRVLQEVGGAARIHIADTGKKMLLHKIARNRKDDLRFFSRSIEQVGFIDELNELYNEFKRYCISAEHLHSRLLSPGAEIAADSGQMKDKLHDIAMIYGDFESELAARYIDAEDVLAMLAERVSDSAYLRGAEVWIDGFHGFTPQEYGVLQPLIRHCRRVSFSLCVDRPYGAQDRPHELDLFHPTAETMIHIRQMADSAGIGTDDTICLAALPPVRFADSPDLAFLERHFAARKIREEGPVRNIAIRSAANRRAEVEGAAREMIALVRDRRCRWRDIAVAVRNMADYEDLLTTVFSDYDIPCFIDAKRSVMHHPLIELIRSALETVNGHWRYEAVFRFVKTDFLQQVGEVIGSYRHRMDLLENYVLAYGIQGSRWTDGKPWNFTRYASLEDEDGDVLHRQEENERIESARQAVVRPLQAFQRSIRKAENVREMTGALFGLLEDVRAADQLERWSVRCIESGEAEKAREHSGIWGSVLDVLDQIVEMMGEQTLSLEAYANILQTGLESIRLGLVPPALDQVLVGSIDRTRSSNIRFSFLLGVNEGVLPAKAEEGSLLSEKERERLNDSGLRLAPGSRRRLLDEQFLIYTALALPSERLWISYPLADEEGRALLPSEIVRQLKRMFPRLEEEGWTGEPAPDEDDRRQLAYIAHPRRALSHLIVQLRQWQLGMEIDDIWWQAYNWFCSRPEWRDKLDRALGALFFTNQESPLSRDTGRKLFGEHLQASVSRMETFVSCHFAHFLSHGLRLQDRRLFRLEAPDIGRLFHAALSWIAAELQREQVHWGDLTAQQCMRRASEAVDRLAPRLNSEILLSTRRYHYIARKLKEVVGRAAVVLGEHARRSGFRPVGLELGFGPGQPLPPLTFALDNGVRMDIVGRIDRVDRADSDQGVLLRVIDYKSGNTSLNVTEVFYGLSLQMLTYLDVAVTHAELWLGTKTLPAGVLYFHVHNPLLQTSNALSRDQAEAEIIRRFKMKGLVLADPEAIRLMDNSLESGYSSIIPVGINKTGGFYKNSSVMTPDRWRQLNAYVRGMIQTIGLSITEGNVDINPYRLGKQTPCAFCSYKPVCQFDPLLEDNRFTPLQMKQAEAVWEWIESGKKADRRAEFKKIGGEGDERFHP